MTTFTERIVAEAEAELQRVEAEGADLRDAMKRAIALCQELADRQKAWTIELSEVARVLAAMKGEAPVMPEPLDVPVIDRRTGEPVELGTVEGVTPVAPDAGDPRSAEEAMAASEPQSNGHGSTAELESPRSERKTPQRVSLEQVRDWCKTQPDKFGTGDVRKAFNIASSTAKRLVDELVNHDPPILEQHGRTGRYVRYTYIPPQNGRGPTHRPNSEREIMRKAGVGAGSVAKRRGITVPRTGKSIGASGKPGRDKKLAEQGKRVKRHRVGT